MKAVKYIAIGVVVCLAEGIAAVSESPNRITGGYDSSLPKCDDMEMYIKPKSDRYRCMDSIVVIVKKIGSDSTLFSIGLDGYRDAWQPVVYAVAKFIDGGKRNADEVEMRPLRPMDSAVVVFPLSKLRGLCKKYKMWRFYAFGYKLQPWPNYKCYLEVEPFTIK